MKKPFGKGRGKNILPGYMIDENREYRTGIFKLQPTGWIWAANAMYPAHGVV